MKPIDIKIMRRAVQMARIEVIIITAYEPSLEIFEADYRTKRKP